MHELQTQKTVNLCKILNNVKVKICKHLTSEFKVNKSLRQGNAIAPLLINVVLETAIRRSNVETVGNIFDKCSQIMDYGDDLVIMWRKLQDVQEVH